MSHRDDEVYERNQEKAAAIPNQLERIEATLRLGFVGITEYLETIAGAMEAVLHTDPTVPAVGHDPHDPQVKRLDDKFSIVDGHIVGPTGVPIPDDEPVFLLRARDRLAVRLLELYYEMSTDEHCTQYHMDGVLNAMRRFESFRDAHPARMKQPGSTGGK